MRVRALLLLALAVAIGLASSAWAGAARVGHDISWPQCGGRLPAAAQPFVIVGLSNGHALHRNPCLGRELDYASSHASAPAAYMMANRPTAGQYAHVAAMANCPNRACVYAEAGAAEAESALAELGGAGYRTNLLWIDVETRPTQPWSARDITGNQAVLFGIAYDLLSHGVEPGWYSTSYMWHLIAGTLPITGAAEWYPIGAGNLAAACRLSFGGGHAVITQAVVGAFDTDHACGGAQAGHVLRAMRLSRG